MRDLGVVAQHLDAEWILAEYGLPAVILDREQRIRRATAGVYHLAGLPPGSLVDSEHPRYLTDLMSPADAVKHGDRFGEVFVGRGPETKRYALGCRNLQRADGVAVAIHVIVVEPPSGVADDFVIGYLIPAEIFRALTALGLAPESRA